MNQVQHEVVDFTSIDMRNIMFFLAEAILLLLLTFTAAVLLRYPVIQKVFSHSFIKSSRFHHSSSAVSADDASVQEQKPYVLPRLRKGMSTKMTMGLKRLDKANWLSIDSHYLSEHAIRTDNLDNHRSSVLQCLPGSEEACREVLDLVSSFLCFRYPNSFTISSSTEESSQSDEGDRNLNKTITNHLTGEVFTLGAENKDPLDTAARLAMEDFNILIKDSEDQYRLQASATLFPAGWRLEERIGGTMALLHGPVPKWQQKLGASVNRYFDHLTPTTAMERHPLFMQTVPELFQSSALASATPSKSSSSVSLATAPSGLFSQYSSADAVTPADIHIRRERQTFTRLPGSGAVLFTVHTFLTPLTTLCDEEVEALIEIAGGWSDDMAAYKGREGWWEELKGYAKDKGLVIPEVNVKG